MVLRNNGNANDASDASDASDAMEKPALWQQGITRYVQAIQNHKFNRKNAQKKQIAVEIAIGIAIVRFKEQQSC